MLTMTGVDTEAILIAAITDNPRDIAARAALQDWWWEHGETDIAEALRRVKG